ncbi:MAG TPA: Rrf2 family transcriptional regulator [Actinomycetota bacterium]|nr:Rrf2 family transcriptional regulator [Actinomycetota bacterium]
MLRRDVEFFIRNYAFAGRSVHIARAGQYAIRALLDMAATGGGTVTGIAERTAVPAPFLQQLIGPLKRAGLLAAKRGPGGGVTLAKSLSDITLLAVLNAVELHEEGEDTTWLSMLPEPHRSRLEGIERLLPDELAMLSLADLVPAGNPADEIKPIADVLPPRRLLDFIGHQAVAVAHADRCAVYFGGESYGFVTTALDVRAKAAMTLPESPTPLDSQWVPSRPVGAIALAWVTGKPVVINDTLNDPRADRMVATRFHIRSVAAFPIHAGVHGSGVLVVSKQKANAWTTDELDRAAELASIAGLAIVGHNHLSTREPSDTPLPSLSPTAPVRRSLTHLL